MSQTQDKYKFDFGLQYEYLENAIILSVILRNGKILPGTVIETMIDTILVRREDCWARPEAFLYHNINDREEGKIRMIHTGDSSSIAYETVVYKNKLYTYIVNAR